MRDQDPVVPWPTRLGRLGILAVRYEIKIWTSLARWVIRRPAVAADEQAFGYTGLIAGLLGLWIFASALEIPLFHVITPWEHVRGALLVLSAWGLLWMLGYYGSLKVHPHAVGPAGVRIRYSATVGALVPWDAVAAVDVFRRHGLPRKMDLDLGDLATLAIPVGNETNVRLQLLRPVEVTTLSRTFRPERLDLYVDDPKAFVAACRARVADLRPS